MGTADPACYSRSSMAPRVITSPSASRVEAGAGVVVYVLCRGEFVGTIAGTAAPDGLMRWPVARGKSSCAGSRFHRSKVRRSADNLVRHQQRVYGYDGSPAKCRRFPPVELPRTRRRRRRRRQTTAGDGDTVQIRNRPCRSRLNGLKHTHDISRRKSSVSTHSGPVNPSVRKCRSRSTASRNSQISVAPKCIMKECRQHRGGIRGDAHLASARPGQCSRKPRRHQEVESRRRAADDLVPSSPGARSHEAVRKQPSNVAIRAAAAYPGGRLVVRQEWRWRVEHLRPAVTRLMPPPGTARRSANKVEAVPAKVSAPDQRQRVSLRKIGRGARSQRFKPDRFRRSRVV